jgi:predicted TPR repeat methyltransferase
VQGALRPGGRFAFTVDTLDGPGDFRITPWAHFMHAPAYIRRLAAACNLRILTAQPVAFPRDGGHDAPGLVFVLAKD